MRRIQALSASLSVAAAACFASPANGEVILFSSAPLTSSFGSTEAYKTLDTPVLDWELAEDIEAHGTITRLYLYGHNPSFFQALAPTGIHVRFYDVGPSGPGALLHSQFVPATAPGFQLGQTGGLDLKLGSQFVANGTYFLSVQMEFASFTPGWYWQYDYSAITGGSPTIWGSSARVKSSQNGFSWSKPLWVGQPIDIQLRFVVYGEDGTPPDLGSDACGIWSEVATPDPSPSDHAILRDVVQISQNDAWSVGHWTSQGAPATSETVPLVQHWDGTNWTTVSTPIPSPWPGGANCGFYSVAAAGPNDVWAAGWQYRQDAAGYVGMHMMVQHWNGSSWSLMSTPPTATLGLQGVSGDVIRGIEVISPNDIWFVGDWVNLAPPDPPQPALAMHWDGSSFTLHDTPYFSNGGHGLESVSATATNDVWAVGGSGDGDWSIASYVIHWNGSQWQHVSLGTPGIIQRLFAVEAIAPNDVWACGQTQIGTSILPWFVHWDGQGWTEVSSPGGTLGLHAFSSHDVYSAGNGVFHWDGNSWTRISGDFADATGISFGAIHGISQCSMLAVGREVVGSDLQTFGAHLVPSTWVDFGGAVAGALQVKPRLVGQGTLLGGEPVVLSVDSGNPQTAGTLFLGSGLLAAPLFGGTFWPQPQIAIGGLITDPTGSLTLFADWPVGVPTGLSIYFQFWQVDSSAPFGVRASNGIGATTP